MTTIARINHILVDDNGIARLKESPKMKVIYLVMDKQAQGWNAEELHKQYPEISLAEIHAAFAYYYDHQKELDQQIAESEKKAQDLWEAQKDDPVMKRLRAIKESRIVS